MNIKPYLNQSFTDLKRSLLTSKDLFCDDLFPTEARSLSYFKKDRPDVKVFWKRPHEISKNPKFIVDGIDPNDFHQGNVGNCWFISAASTLCSIPALYKHVIPEDNECFSKAKYAGIFHFRFYKLGEWVDVVVDDRIPVDEDDDFIYCSNQKDKNEFFVPLLEKAYSKLNGCYMFTDGGEASDAMTDLTGAVCENFDINGCIEKTYGREEDDSDSDTDDEEDDEEEDESEDTDDEEEDDEEEDESEDEEEYEEASNFVSIDLSSLWLFMNNSHRMKSLMNAAFNGEEDEEAETERPSGLLSSHAYSILQVVEVKLSKKNRVRLIKLRNPHGTAKNWTGHWNSRSKQWKKLGKEIKKKYKLTLSSSTGEFYMTFDDFIEHFDDLNVAHVNANSFMALSESGSSYIDSQWSLREFLGAWKEGVNAGYDDDSLYNRNTQYYLKIDESKSNDTSSLVIALMQPYSAELRKENDGEYCNTTIMLDVHKLHADQKKIDEHLSAGKKFALDELEDWIETSRDGREREVTKRCYLETGSYIVIACCQEEDTDSKYLLRFLHDKTKCALIEALTN